MSRVSWWRKISATVIATGVCVCGCSPKVTESTRKVKEVSLQKSPSVIDADATPLRQTGFSMESSFFLAAANSSVIKAATSKAPRLMLFYMVGSNLEDDSLGGEDGSIFLSQVGETSNDLRELIRGYSKLTLPERASVKVLVAFGGSLKEDWRGVKIADIDCLIRDGGPGEIPLGAFGDDNCYLSKDPAKDIGSKAALLDFLKFAKAKVGPTSSVSLVMGDHGGALAGFGNALTLKSIDDKTRDKGASLDSHLSVNDIADAIKESELQIDLLGFDACLMGNFETAFILRNSAKFLIASPEVEPGHGWAYNNFMRDFVTSDSLAVFARRVIEAYAWYGESIAVAESGQAKKISHMSQNNKILSLYDLRSTENLSNSWTSFWNAVQIEDKQLFSALAVGHHYHSPYTDMRVFAKNLADQTGSLDAVSLVEAIDKTVIYVATDSSITADGALSMVNPLRSDLYNPAESDFKSNDRISSQWRVKVDELEKSWKLFKKSRPAYRAFPAIPCRGPEMAYNCVEHSESKLVNMGYFFSLRKASESTGELGVALPKMREDASGQFQAAVGYGANLQSWPAVCDGPCATATKFAYIAVKDVQEGKEANKLKSLIKVNGKSLSVSMYVKDEYLLSVEFLNPWSGALLGKASDIGFRAGDLIEIEGNKLTLTTDGFLGFRPLPVAGDLLVWPITRYVFDEWVKDQMGDGLISKFYIAGQPWTKSSRIVGCNRRTGNGCHQKCEAGDWNALQGLTVNDCRWNGCVGTRALCFGAPEDLKVDPVLTDLMVQDAPCGEGDENMGELGYALNARSSVTQIKYFCGSRAKLNDSGYGVGDVRIMGLGENLSVAPKCPADFSERGLMPDCGNASAKFCKGEARLCVKHKS